MSRLIESPRCNGKSTLLKKMAVSRLEQELGPNYQNLILNYLNSERVINHGYSPTWWITFNHGWKGKSYWVRAALNQMKADGLVESFKHRGGVGWCWALQGKLVRG